MKDLNTPRSVTPIVMKLNLNANLKTRQNRLTGFLKRIHGQLDPMTIFNRLIFWVNKKTDPTIKWILTE